MPTDLETAQAKVLELEAKLKAQADASTEYIKARDTQVSINQVLQTRLTQMEATTNTASAEVTAKLVALQEQHKGFQTKYQAGITKRLIDQHKLSPDNLKDKTLDQLEAIEEALSANKLITAPGGNAPATPTGLGLTGGGGATPTAAPGSLEFEMQEMQKAKRAAGIRA